VLPAAHRLRRSVDFDRAVRRGVRAGRKTVVVHLCMCVDGGESAMVGFVVSRAVGSAVRRNRVKRRLRECARRHLGLLPPRSLAVVRATPAAASAGFDELSSDVSLGFRAAVRRWTDREGRA
jgi:ribonuclease P protein component